MTNLNILLNSGFLFLPRANNDRELFFKEEPEKKRRFFCKLNVYRVMFVLDCEMHTFGMLVG